MHWLYDVLGTRYRRRRFFAFGIGAFALLGIARFVILPMAFGKSAEGYEDVFAGILNNLLAALASTIATIAFLAWITPPVLHETRFRIVEPGDLKRTLDDELLKDTSEFYHLGNTARWTRAVTLSKIMQQAQRDNLRKTVSMIISSPDDEDVCSYYANFGHTMRPGDRDHVWNLKRVRRELFATILYAYCAAREQRSFLILNVYLANRVSLFRLDLSASAAILTKPYPQEPALCFPAGSFFYDTLKEEWNIVREQSRGLINPKDLPADLIVPSRQRIDEGTARAMLTALGFDTADLTPDDFDAIVQEVKNPTNPYPDRAPTEGRQRVRRSRRRRQDVPANGGANPQ